MDINFSDLAYTKCDRCREGKINDPKELCYYHRKVEAGLIDEPEREVAWVDRWNVDDKDTKTLVKAAQYIVFGLFKLHESWGPEMAEDAVQYCMLGVPKLLEQFKDDEASLSTFARRSFKNRVTDFMRKESIHQQRTWYAFDEFLERALRYPDIEEAYIADQDRKLFYEILDALELSDREQRLIDDRLLSDNPVTFEEIAIDENVTKQAIQQSEIRLLEKLREVYRGYKN